DLPAEEPADGLLEQVPDDTVIVPLDDHGAVLPLAGQDAVDVIANGDPIWCPAGQPPIPGENGCTDTFASFDALLTYLQGNENDVLYQQAGVIYIETGDYAGDETSIDFNDYLFGSLNNYDLSLQGGWNPGTHQVDDDSLSQFVVPISIGSTANPWLGSIFIDNLMIDGVDAQVALTICSAQDVIITDSMFTDSAAGVVVAAGGAVVLDGVTADNNATTGAEIVAGGNVEVYASSFSNNGSSQNGHVAGGGLDVASGGSVTLYDVIADGNNVFGAAIDVTGDFAVTSSSFSGNGSYTCGHCSGLHVYGYGLKVVAGGYISLYEVTAESNNLYGSYLETNSGASVGASSFSSNGFALSNKVATGYGLQIKSDGYVSLYDVTADNNHLYGAYILTTADVSVSNSSFSGNALTVCTYCSSCQALGYGLKVETAANINVYGVVANGNNLYGTSLNANGNVSVTSSEFNGNGAHISKDVNGYGLQVNSGGYVSVYDVTANDNNLYGANIVAIADVSISSSSFSGNGSTTCSSCGGTSVYGYGLKVTTDGYASVNAVVADANHLFGANLDAAGGVTVGASSFSGNGFALSNKVATGYGLQIKSDGVVSLYDVTADNNHLYGANIQSGMDVSVSSSSFSGNKVCVCTHCGCCTATGYGLNIDADGNIDLYEVVANGNAVAGATLVAQGEISVYGGSFSNNTRGNGLVATAGEQITLFAVTASGNKSNGATLVAVGDVNVTGSTFADNGSLGLSAKTAGVATLTSVSAVDNGSHGVYVVGDGCIEVYVISGAFTGNHGHGIKVVNAALTLSDDPLFASNSSGNTSVRAGVCGSGSSGCHHGCHHGCHNWTHSAYHGDRRYHSCRH
ncbi:MAG: right-handed parallel beta-helix repeat-containing protein, partial [Anaerolineales bacterium]|nr:right-handed parallel beta-helix repeat-containing protein [Anaerolineales bacterium]